MARKLFITGTGTDIGKTYVAALIVKKMREHHKKVAYYKAAMSGNERDASGALIPGDALHVKSVSGIEQSLETMCPYVYESAVSPHLASRIEGNPVDLCKVKAGCDELELNYDFITLEGSGGILCPLNFTIGSTGEHLMLEDVIYEVDAPTLIVADAGLGTINDVCLTYYYMKRKGMKIKGVIFNNYHPGNVMEEDNIKMCEYMTGLKTIACVKPGDTGLEVDGDELAALYE